ncbi:cache domain-containing protein [Ancylobacter terrae]|uniref:cache domain-containing protein n=1 Tax=Ancylobacter sp. sgz301288 TaxID=3342077 RepID=UPI00385DCF81
MKRHLVAGLALALGLAAGGAALAEGGKGTAAQAKAMLERAVAALKADRPAALAAFKARADGFGEGDLYVFCNGLDGASIEHPNPAMAGTNLNTLKDANGKEFGRIILREAQEGRISTVDYEFPELGGTKPLPKETFFTRIGTLICGVGYYR